MIGHSFFILSGIKHHLSIYTLQICIWIQKRRKGQKAAPVSLQGVYLDNQTGVRGRKSTLTRRVPHRKLVTGPNSHSCASVIDNIEGDPRWLTGMDNFPRKLVRKRVRSWSSPASFQSRKSQNLLANLPQRLYRETPTPDSACILTCKQILENTQKRLKAPRAALPKSSSSFTVA